MRKLFDRMPDKPAADDLDSYHREIMSIAEAIGLHSLNIPALRNLWTDPSKKSLMAFQAAIGRGGNDARMRFVALCNGLADIPYPEVRAWSETVWNPAESDATRLPGIGSRGLLDTILALGLRLARNKEQKGIERVRRSHLMKEDTAKVIKVLTDSLFPESSHSLPKAEDIEDIWATHMLIHSFSVELDRYAQVCVHEPAHTLHVKRELPVTTLRALREFEWSSPFLLARVQRPKLWEMNFIAQRPREIILTAPGVFGTIPTWTAPLEAARTFLQNFGRTKPIIATSLGYSVKEGDFAGTNILREVPHAVTYISDFRSLWMDLACWNEGLVGSRIIEYMPLPSISGDPYYGYLLLKPAGRNFPVIVNPYVHYFGRRVISVVDFLPSPRGVRLEMVKNENSADWLGPEMHKTVATAALVFEHGPQLPLGTSPGN
jgi:hypothetical protein